MTAHTDYLVIGCGANALAFVDAMLHASDATFTIVDRRHAPGGHWNDAYGFVRLHQPSTCYGVTSRPLGCDRIDQTGFNKGLYELATGAEVTHYFHSLMSDVLLPSGRVTYHPLSEYTSDGEIVGLLSGERRRVEVRRKIVDATRMETSVPLTHSRKFTTAAGVTCIPPNDLVRVAPRHRRFAVLGGGKTALDAASFLLAHGVDPSAITWVIPRDAWLWNRRYLQPGSALFPQTLRALAEQYEIFATADSLPALAQRLESAHVWLRLDGTVQPTMQHGATVSEPELEQLRKIEGVVRLGRVQHIDPERLVLSRGEVAVHPDTLHVDCTASALAQNVRDATPIFAPGKIALQMVRVYQPTFSAALIGHVEASITDEAEKAALLEPASMTDTLEDFASSQAATLRNQLRMSRNPSLRAWVVSCRLDGYGKLFAALRPEDTALIAEAERFRKSLGPALKNLEQLRR